jgi:LAGLIDADG endonuclease
MAPIDYQAGQKISPATLDQLRDVNAYFTKTRNRAQYNKDIALVFGISPDETISLETKFFLGGFIEGEGSLNVSLKKGINIRKTLNIDPEFSVTQHINGITHLYKILVVLNAGRISHKSGSNATMVLKIDNRQTLKEIVLPFYKTYVYPYSSPYKRDRIDTFSFLIKLFEKGVHLNKDTMCEQILPLWDKMRMQKGQSNETFGSLEEAIAYLQEG